MRPQHMFYATLCAAALALPCASAASANIVISINQNTQHMLVTVDGVTRYDWPVSTGRAGHGTPDGVFRVNRMDAAHHSKEYDNAFMPDSMFFDLNGHAIHGFNDVPHLGMAVSHGCVRLAPANAAVLFSLVKQEGMANTTVQISGRIPARYPMVARQQMPTQEASTQPPTQIAPQDYAAAPGYGPAGLWTAGLQSAAAVCPASLQSAPTGLCSIRAGIPAATGALRPAGLQPALRRRTGLQPTAELRPELWRQLRRAGVPAVLSAPIYCHAPRKRGIQYSQIQSLKFAGHDYWIARLRGR